VTKLLQSEDLINIPKMLPQISTTKISKPFLTPPNKWNCVLTMECCMRIVSCMQTILADLDCHIILIYYWIIATREENMGHILCIHKWELSLQALLIQSDLCMNHVNGLPSNDVKSPDTNMSRQIILIYIGMTKMSKFGDWCTWYNEFLHSCGNI
jgi:hypothetical protein